MMMVVEVVTLVKLGSFGWLWILWAFTVGHVASDWDKWWSYQGINGPTYWGQANPDWKLCRRGRQQSPINIEPSRLLFDPNLKHLRIESSTVKSLLKNNGHGITMEIQSSGLNTVNLSMGPLSYNYIVSEVKIHLASNDNAGSEHKIAGRSFPAEMHVIAYNSDLYKNITEASKGVKGLAIIAIFFEVGPIHDKLFMVHIATALKSMRHKGSETALKEFTFSNMIPNTTEYVTYEGSLTQPGCYETVTWILLNKPLWIGKEQLSDLRSIFNGRENEPDLPLQSNIRPLMQLNHRVVRTNINSHKSSRLCTFEREMFYQVNARYDRP